MAEQATALSTTTTNPDIDIRPLFRDLIPKLGKHELEKLEDSILAEGIREPLIIAVFEETNVHGILTTARVLVDGHHRHAIAMKHGLTFDTRDIEFEDEDAALVWAIDNQLGRRNIIHPLDRVILLEKKRPILERQAQERQQAGKADDGDLAPKTEQGGKKRRGPTVLEQLAREAGMGKTTYVACLKILAKGIPALIKFVREGDMSISAADTLLAHNDDPKWQQGLVDRVKGDPDAMQAVVRNINWRARDYTRIVEGEEREKEKKRKEEEEYQAGEERDEKEIAEWRATLPEVGRNEEEPVHEPDTAVELQEQGETDGMEEDLAAPTTDNFEVQEEEEEEPVELEQQREMDSEEAARREEMQKRREDVAALVDSIVGAVLGQVRQRGLYVIRDGADHMKLFAESWIYEYVHEKVEDPEDGK